MPLASRPRQAIEIESLLTKRLPQWRETDGRLPSETELANEFGVSRVTVREALASLERRGLILRKQGLGTFVNRSAANIQTRLEESVEFGELIRAAGFEARLGFLDQSIIPTPPALAERLLLAPQAPALQLRKVFSADGTPVIYCLNLIPLDLLPPDRREQTLAALQPQLSTYTLLARWFDQRVDYQISDAEACAAPPDAAQLLGCAPGAPLFRIQDVGYNDHQRPVFYGDVFFVPGMIQFRLVRKPIYEIEALPPIPQSSPPAA